MIDELELKQLGQLFAGVLRSRLILLGYTIAVPDPDIGEDLWIAAPVDRSNDAPERTVFRAQLKSARSKGKEGRGSYSYETNDYSRTLTYVHGQPKFVYFYGLYDERLGSRVGEQFHIGCVPAAYWKRIETHFPGAGVNKDRYYWQMRVKRGKEERAEYTVVCNIRRAANFDLTRFFCDFEYGLRVARGSEPLPEPVIIPDRDHGKRRNAHQKAKMNGAPTVIAS